jgi:hypothetical protein
MSRQPHRFTAVTGCRIEIPDGRVTVEGTDVPDATLDIRLEGDPATARGATEDVAAVQTTDGALTIRLAEAEPTRSRWLRAERRPRPVIHLRIPRAVWVAVETVGADVHVSGCAGRQDVTTVTGSVAIDHAQGSVSARTVSGSIAIAGGALTARAATTSGRVRVDALRLDSLQLRSVSGRVGVTGRLAAGSDHRIETLSGDIRITTNDGLLLDARTVSGRLVADSGARRESRGGTSLLIVGDGSTEAQVTTVSGDIRLALGDAATPGAGALAAHGPDPMLEALEALARGDISVEEADRRLEVLHG